jgi:hypothetical protein
MENPEDNKEFGNIGVNSTADDKNLEQKVDTEKSPSDSRTATESEKEHEYITGWKLVLVLAAVTLVVFLMLLDMSIIVTVSIMLHDCHAYVTDKISRPSLASQVTFTHCQTLDGMAVHIFSPGICLILLLLHTSNLIISIAVLFNH